MNNLINTEVHIASFLINHNSTGEISVKDFAKLWPELELNHFAESPGKCIAILETHKASKIKQLVHELERLKGVLSVALIYHQYEDEEELNEEVA